MVLAPTWDVGVGVGKRKYFTTDKLHRFVWLQGTGGPDGSLRLSLRCFFAHRRGRRSPGIQISHVFAMAQLRGDTLVLCESADCLFDFTTVHSLAVAFARAGCTCVTAKDSTATHCRAWGTQL